MSRVGVMGGTFDPIHTGHLLLAQHLKEHLNLDRVLFVPAASPPHKDNREDCLATVNHRWKMVSLAIAGADDFEASSVEMDRAGLSYTVDTLRSLREQHSDSDLFLLIGADNITDLSTWFDPEGIFGLCTVVAGSRVTATSKRDAQLANRITLVDTPVVDISSTDIRKRVRTKHSIRWLVPREVEDYIHIHGLYR